MISEMLFGTKEVRARCWGHYGPGTLFATCRDPLKASVCYCSDRTDLRGLFCQQGDTCFDTGYINYIHIVTKDHLQSLYGLLIRHFFLLLIVYSNPSV